MGGGIYIKTKVNAFTLIELLAIIVILAVIAVITVPIILGIIDDAKKNSAIDSAYGYKDAINKFYVTKLAKDKDYTMEDKDYTVTELSIAGLSISGKQPGENSWVTIEKNNVVAGCLQFDEYKVEIKDGKIEGATIGECILSPSFKYASLIVTSGDGLYESTTDSGRLIYRGENPNNRIFLKEDGINNTLYRIVSYELDGTIKVVRDEKLSTNIAWDESFVRNGNDITYCSSDGGCNVWGNQTNMLHNGESLGDNFHYFYYSSSTATTLSNGNSGRVGTIDSTLNKYLNNGDWSALTNLGNYIDNHYWNVGGIYISEDKGIVKEKEEERQLTWNGKVGLMSITEYAEASLNSTCTSVIGNYASVSGSPCKELNWTYKNYDQWSISANSRSKNTVWNMNSSGYFYYNYAYGNTYGIRPAFYLKSGISLTGTGAPGDEYQIVGM